MIRREKDGQKVHPFMQGEAFRNRKKAIIALSAVVLLLCGLFLHFTWIQFQKSASSEAINLAQSVEALVHPEHIALLSGNLEDMEKPEYYSAKYSLMRFVKTAADIRFAYIYREKNGDIVFLVDSEPEDSSYYSPPGQINDEATAEDMEPLLTGKTTLTEPSTDRWGTWISVLVPIQNPSNGKIIAVFGVDYSASLWHARLLEKMIPSMIIMVILIVLYIAVIYIWVQRQKYKSLSKKLEWDEALYHSIFEQAPVGIAIVSNKNFIQVSPLGNIAINPMFMEIFGRTSQELVNIPWPDITHPDDLQADLDQFDQFQKGAIKGYAMEKRFLRKDGSYIWTHMKISSLSGLPIDQPMHLCLLEDISARKAAEDSLKESERSKAVLVSNLPGLAYRCSYDREWTMQFVSDGCLKLTGYSKDQLLHNRAISYNDIIAPEYRERLWKQWGRVLQKKRSLKTEYEIITASGVHKWVMELGEGVFNEHGQVIALEGIVLDISDRKKAERQIKSILKRSQSMINNHQAVMLLIEPGSGNILEANKAATDFYGYAKDELLQMTIQDINTMDPENVRSLRLRVLEKGQRYYTIPHRLKSGEIRLVDIYSNPIVYDNQTVLFSIIFDVTDREKIAKQIEFMAYHDYLTSLYNRRFFEEEFGRRIRKEEFPIGVFLGDVDGFKVYNDTYGHAEGDAILRNIADDLKAFVGDKGIVARIGGDEFAILTSGMEKTEIRRYLDKLNQNFIATMNDSSIIEHPTISWGYGYQRKQEDTLDIIIAEAEAFMYNRKFYSYQSSRSKTVDAIMETLFAKSEREKKHSERVGMLAAAIARAMHLSNAEIDKIRVAGFLHDIGKIGIDEAVLNKAGTLDMKEWEMIKLHPAKGAGILEKTLEYRDISKIVLSHHERFDGQGYPGKLQAEDIPLGARIIAVADTYDAITNERTYRTPLNKSAAVEEIKNSAGTQLDPEIVSIFIQMIFDESNEYMIQA